MRSGCRSTCARLPRSAAQYERMQDEHGFRLLDYTVGPELGLAAGLLPVFRNSQPGRFRAVRGAGRERQAGADDGGSNSASMG